MHTRFRDDVIAERRFEARLFWVKVATIMAGALLVAGCIFQSCSDAEAVPPEVVPVEVGGLVVDGRTLYLREPITIYVDPWTATELGLEVLD